ncbi:RNA-binding protein [Ammoniphilus sp. CFH 90114]|uniref:YlmH family RNA-binding protein n=1 Tax=Ammoniphilus sp. CFH 90114 TaxID=2493665 RepID=UPI00100EAAB1|nr:YlmH/Sll1252 family protein [Ammoniphilus sp. CFH 90114]RXT15021.1 RNA-binding protein [Ammoniphilus sp. CFH 90114]
MSLYEHFRPEERPFIERAIDWLEQVDQQHHHRRTDFLDPRQIYILRNLSSRFQNLTLSSFGGYASAERCRVLIHQDYWLPEEEDYSLVAFEVTSPSPGFGQLKHKDFLGSLTGIGLKRDKYGDILVHSDSAQLIVAAEIADYVRLQLNQVHRLSVSLEQIRLGEITPLIEEWKATHLTVSSTRADVVAGDVFRLSRSKILPPIRAGHLKVNWMVVDSPSFQIREGDIVSLRGYGRFKVLKEEGMTRKGNIRLEIGLLLN